MSRAPARPADGDTRFGWIVALVAIAALAAGFAGATLLFGEAERGSSPPQYLRFSKLDVHSHDGLAVLSFDLETDREDLRRLEAHKAALETAFRVALARDDLRSYYTPESRAALAARLRDTANRELGGPLVDAVYFGDFKLYHRR